jgi:hypothetical protein
MYEEGTGYAYQQEKPGLVSEMTEQKVREKGHT